MKKLSKINNLPPPPLYDDASCHHQKYFILKHNFKMNKLKLLCRGLVLSMVVGLVFVYPYESLFQSDTGSKSSIFAKASAQSRVKRTRASQSSRLEQARKRRQIVKKRNLSGKASKARVAKSKKGPNPRGAVSRQRKDEQKWTVASFHRLPLRHKVRLHGLVVATMSALEISRNGSPDARRTAFFHYLWNLGLPFAYAQGRGGCFFGGHFQQNCRGSEIYSQNECELPRQRGRGSEIGVKCNGNLFPTQPCVYRRNNNPNNTGGRIRGYATTQACAYADAIRMKAFLNQTDTDAITPDELNTWASNNIESGTQQTLDENLWGVPIDPDQWMEKTNDLRTDIDGEKANAYYGLVQNELVENLENIKEKCEEDITNWFEKKHCDFFEKELEEMQAIADRLPSTPEETPVEASECVSFRQLPGEHFCQAKKGDEYLVVRLEGKITIERDENGNFERPIFTRSQPYTAVVYRSDSAKGPYCPHEGEDFQYKEIIEDDDSGHTPIQSNLQSPHSRACLIDTRSSRRNNIRYDSNVAHFQNMTIRKNIGKTNLCNFNTDPSKSLIVNGYRNNDVTNFLPGFSDNDNQFDSENLNSRIRRERRLFFSSPENNNTPCYSSDLVALYEADMVLQHHKKCAEKNVRTYIRDKWNIDDRIGRRLPSSLAENQVLRLNAFLPTNGRRHYFYQENSPSDNRRVTLFSSPNYHLGRKYRTWEDWFYGDGFDAESVHDNPQNPAHIRHPGLASSIPVLCDDEPSSYPLNRIESGGSSGGLPN